MPGPKDWIAEALVDLKLAKKLIQDDDEFLKRAIYFVHQSVEKSLKTILVYHGNSVPRSHDLEFLLQEAAKFNPFIKVFEKQIIIMISPYESNTRYPDDRFFIGVNEVVQGIEIAEQVLKVVAQYVHVKI